MKRLAIAVLILCAISLSYYGVMAYWEYRGRVSFEAKIQPGYRSWVRFEGDPPKKFADAEAAASGDSSLLLSAE